METRELFWSLSQSSVVLFYIVGFSAIGVFLWGCWRHFSKYRQGAAVPDNIDVGSGLSRMIADLFSHRTLVRRDRYAGYAHAGIFFGFLLAAIGTSIITLEYDILAPLFGIKFWRGDFYLWFSLILDIGHLALTVGIIMMMWRRAMFHLAKLDYMRGYRGETELRESARSWRIEDWIFLSVLLVIEITGFLQEAVRLMMDQPEWAAWSPIGLALANVLSGLGMTYETAAVIRGANWWIHGVLALAFTATIPWYKAKHILAVVGSLTVRDGKPLRRLPMMDETKDTPGFASIADFSWKDMLNFDACTKCGRCHEACPARTVGYPLSPRDFILDLRLHNDETQGRPVTETDLIGDIIDVDTLWACRTCGACQEICPVGIEHPTMIVQMRRQLIDRGALDPLLQTTLDTIGNTGNSFGENPRKRAAWVRDLEFRVKDIREEPAEYLWFVGDYASYDPRNQKVSQTVARLLHVAGVDFAILYESERTAGNDVRRTGEEGLFESLSESNLEQFAAARSFSRIITTDPHSYNTLKNEYPDFGQIVPVEHYTEVLSRLLCDGKLKVVKPLDRKVTYHDPCHLGRLNGEYESPRQVIEFIGGELVEMPRNRDNSFCCGAGGGRIWIPDQPGIEKPSENRMHEAAALDDVACFVTCCPKDLTMFEDARKTSGHEKDLVVEDIAELVAEAIDIKSIPLKDLPTMTEKITEAVAARVADVVGAKIDQVLQQRLSGLPTAAVAAPLLAPDAMDGEQETKQVQPSQEVTSAHEETTLLAQPAPGDDGPAPIKALKAMDWNSLAPIEPPQLEGYEVPKKTGARILVAVKHAAVLGDDFHFTSDNRDIQQADLDHVLNEWDDAALEEALLLIEKQGGGEVVAVTIGPEDADTSLRKVLAKGADRAVRVWHDDLIAADPLTVARAIAGVAVLEQPDLILTGVQSSDHANGATGAALARILGMPQAAVAVGLEWDGTNKLSVTRELEGGVRHKLELPSPAVVTIQTGINTPRYATMRMIKQAKKKPLEVVDGAAVIDGGGGYRVRRMYVPEQTKAEMLSGNSDDIASFIANLIREHRGS